MDSKEMLWFFCHKIKQKWCCCFFGSVILKISLFYCTNREKTWTIWDRSYLHVWTQFMDAFIESTTLWSEFFFQPNFFPILTELEMIAIRIRRLRVWVLKSYQHYWFEAMWFTSKIILMDIWFGTYILHKNAYINNAATDGVLYCIHKSKFDRQTAWFESKLKN